MIMELLYDGRIYPREEINCKDERYRQKKRRIPIPFTIPCIVVWTMRRNSSSKKFEMRCMTVRAMLRRNIFIMGFLWG